MFFIYNGMIINFKMFEYSTNSDDDYKSQAWVVPIKIPDFFICLKKIGMDEKDVLD